MTTVTAVMITGKHASRRDLAMSAVRSFNKQIYGGKDLLIINDGEEPLFVNGLPLHIREIQVPKGSTLGQLRNIGLAEATGDVIMQWDDDDWSHPIRMGYQVKSWERSPANAILLRWQVRYSFISDSARYWGWTTGHPTVPGIPGTILHANEPGISYRSEKKAEDDHFLEDHFQGKITVLENSPVRGQAHYYVRFYHGGNTWDEQHVMGDQAAGEWDVDEDTRTYLERLLKFEYTERGPHAQED
jgi:glycosyltransferase involved in cell wall biosynthesis